MTVNVSTAKTKRFADSWVYIPGLISVALLISSIFGLPPAKTLLDKTVRLEEEEIVKVGEIDLQASKIGALRIDVTSSFNNSRSLNDWIVYEIQLIDKQGQIIASAIDEDWKESGTWREDGESGTWRESDLKGGIDVRLNKAEKIDVAIALLERNELTGISVPAPVSFKVKIQNNVIERGVLAWGGIHSGIVALFALCATQASGKKVIGKRIADSDPFGRAIVGGTDNLVRVTIKVKLDERAQRYIYVNVKLSINNAYGERVFSNIYKANVMVVKNNNNVSGTANLKLFFVLEPYNSYGFQVNVTPDNPVDWTSLEIRQGCKTIGETEVITIGS